MDITKIMRGALASIGLATATSASEPPKITFAEREALVQAQNIRLELSKIKLNPDIPADNAILVQEAKHKLGLSCAEEFKRVTDPVSGKIFAEPENKACAAFRPVENKLSF